MSTRLITSLVLAMIFSIFGNPTEAEEPEAVLIIAADHSVSMHQLKVVIFGISIRLPESHINLLANAIEEAMREDFTDCNALTVEYLPWGDKPEFGVSVKTSNAAARAAFVAELKDDLRYKNLGGTNHRLAWDEAVKMASRSDAVAVAILFITDESGEVVALKPPKNATVYKVAIDVPGYTTVRAYLETGMAAGRGTVYSATTSAELSTVLKQIFREMGTRLCLG